MTATNHALTGAVIATLVANPVIGLPLAFLSHFVLDSLPHFGQKFGERKKLTRSVWATDSVTLSIVMFALVLTGNWLSLIGALLAISPDVAWVYRFVFTEKLGKLPPKSMNKFNGFHAGIQKFETPGGLIVEIAWGIIFGALLAALL